MDARRRQFLGVHQDTAAVRPPWIEDPDNCTETCTRCGKCIALCPEQILRVGDGGFPEVDFSRGECTFCAKCTTDCEVSLFATGAGTSPWTHTAVVSEQCLASRGVMCRSCEDSCEPRAIRFPLVVGAVPRPVINVAACTACGACIKPCPEQAISMA